MTLQTVADLVGVSRMTVSNAFSRPDQLSAELRARILAAADDLGYVGPDPAGRALARGTTGAVGVLLTESVSAAFEDDAATGFFGALADELAPTGMAVALLPSETSAATIPARDVPIDGALVYSCAGDTPALHWLQKRKLPLVFVDQAPVGGADAVLLDDRGGARQGAEHVLGLGHRRVGLLTMGRWDEPSGLCDPASIASGGAANYVAAERVAGWLEALEPAGAHVMAVQMHRNDDADAYAGATLLLEGDDRPTAVLCFSDVMAAGVLRAARDLGLRVPEDVSVVGFDDAPLATRTRPSLTTLRQDVTAKGRLAAQVLTGAIARARNGGGGEPRRELLVPELVVRRSTGPAPSAR
ncbi:MULTISPECIES: LacI family DNA-binding transcriptional regulator [unclassified Actinotalea]|uniref:LacI family DNA-binding transcriptional regulator n=1 Tax=unclassified Actinotalea TaxID=2638618 RepID=UPI002104CAE7|nr:MULTISPECIES: LacI family DNA-binding transcriptional regulator [unclassified Actinotalea]